MSDKYLFNTSNALRVIKQGHNLIAEAKRRGYTANEIAGIRNRTADAVRAQIRDDAKRHLEYLDREAADLARKYSDKPRNGEAAQMREFELNRLRDALSVMTEAELCAHAERITADPLTAPRDEVTILDGELSRRKMYDARIAVAAVRKHEPHEFAPEWKSLQDGREVASLALHGAENPHSQQGCVPTPGVGWQHAGEFVDSTLRSWEQNGVPAGIKSVDEDRATAEWHAAEMRQYGMTTPDWV